MWRISIAPTKLPPRQATSIQCHAPGVQLCATRLCLAPCAPHLQSQLSTLCPAFAALARHPVPRIIKLRSAPCAMPLLTSLGTLYHASHVWHPVPAKLQPLDFAQNTAQQQKQQNILQKAVMMSPCHTHDPE